MEFQFKKITLDDREIIQAYLEKKQCRSCELVFANIYLWSRTYPTEYAIIEDTLVFLSRKEPLSVTFPAGEVEKVHRVIDMLLLYFEEKGIDFHMHLVQKSEFELMEQWYPNRFKIEYNRDLADYVYDREKLTSLAGKKLHGKRNHINKFKQLYENWSYERITDENVEECFQMALKWREEHGCETDDEKRAEICVTLNSLRLMNELNLIGGLLRVAGRVVAFTIGEPITKDMFVVHIEKAFKDVEGAYTIINQQFVANELQAYQYINREEDTGAEGLRKAKLSYRPEFLIEKGFVTEQLEG